MSEIQLSSKQKKLLDAFDGDAYQDVKDWRWDAGGTGEAPIFNKVVNATPTVISELIFHWLDENDKVICPHGLEDKDAVVYKRLKKQVMSEAAKKLEENNEVLLPNGETVPVEEVSIGSQSQ